MEKPKRGDIMGLAGAWSDMPEMDNIFHTILKNRKKYKGRMRVEL